MRLMKCCLIALAAMLVSLISAARVHAWGACHVGYTHVGPNGAYHYGHTSAYGPYGGYSGGHVGGSGYGGYHAGYGGYHSSYGGGYGDYGYHYGSSSYDYGYSADRGYHYGAMGYGGAYGDAYRAGVYRRW